MATFNKGFVFFCLDGITDNRLNCAAPVSGGMECARKIRFSARIFAIFIMGEFDHLCPSFSFTTTGAVYPASGVTFECIGVANNSTSLRNRGLFFQKGLPGPISRGQRGRFAAIFNARYPPAAHGAPRYGTTGYEYVGLACTRVTELIVLLYSIVVGLCSVTKPLTWPEEPERF